jgi:HAD superfamily hydrolase (TIGR01509 family)
LIKYKAVLFGSIGTIIETSDLQRKAFNQAFKKNNLNWLWTKKIYKDLLNKSGGKDRISNYAFQKKISVDAELLRNLKTKIFNEYLKKKKLKPRPGVKQLVKNCKKKGIKLALVTTTTNDNINSIFFCLKKSLNKKDFDFIGNSKIIKKPKPFPDVYKFALKNLKLKANQCIAIEDSQESLNSAIRANIKCLIFPGEFHTSKKFKGALKKIKRVSRNIIE